MKNLAVIAIGILALAPAVAEAQMCAGAPSFTAAPLQVGAATAFQDGARGVGGSFAVGGDALFGGAQVSTLSFSGLDASHTNIALFAGSDVSLAANERVFVCPLALMGFGSGPDLDPIEMSTFDMRGGGSIGITAYDRDGLMLVPTFGLSLGWQRMTASLGGQSMSVSDTVGLANLGVGMVINQRFGVVPSVSIPFSTPQSDARFTLGLVYHFGR